MCDTVVATPIATDRGVTLFGKNSDRERNEAHALSYFAGATHPSGTAVQCQYIKIEQAERTFATLLCRPFWAWGAEMGANSKCVVIGNEAVHSKIDAGRNPALTGNDLVRLTLERAATAEEACELIAVLLERHGQGGNCGHLTPNYYLNSFIVADPSNCFVIETLGRDWMVRKIEGAEAVSNAYTIDKPDKVSAGMPSVLARLGEDVPLSYAAAIANPNREHIGHAGARRSSALSFLRSQTGPLKYSDIMALLRDHDGQGDGWAPSNGLAPTICMHAGLNGKGEERPGQTTGSLVSELGGQHCIHWVTGTSAPCLSIFKPILMTAAIPDMGPPPSDHFDLHSLWWRHEQLHRSAILGDFGECLKEFSDERDALERSFDARISEVLNGGNEQDRSWAVETCWSEAMRAESRWLKKLAPRPALRSRFASAWHAMDERAGFLARP